MFAIAKNTFIETIRDRILYTVLFFGGLLIVASLLASDISLHQNQKIISDFGLAFISIFSTIITLFIGSKLIFAEIYNQTISVLLSKPIKRSQFIFGKWLGLTGVIFTITLLLSLFFLAVLWIQNLSFSLLFLVAIFFGFLEQLILISILIFFATFTSSPVICLFCTIALYVSGHLTEDLVHFALQKGSEIFRTIAFIIYYIVPNFEYFNLKNQVIYNIGVPLEHGLLVIAYGIGFILLILFFATKIFERKEF